MPRLQHRRPPDRHFGHHRRLAPLLRSLNRPSRRLLRTAWQARLVIRERERVWYASWAPGTATAQPRRPPVAAGPAALSEIEAAYYAGFRSIRAFKWAQRHGDFPKPARKTPSGPVWLVSQIDAWLAGDLPPQVVTVIIAEHLDEYGEMSPDEADLLAKIESFTSAAPAPART